jgi:CBS domain containing-hemolysin-like protein
MLIFGILIFLFLSAFFSGSEIAFISANKLGVEVERGKGTRRGRILASFFDHPKDFMSAMLVGNNISLVAFTTLMALLIEPQLERFLDNEWVILSVLTLISTIVVLLFGEFLPKVFAGLYSNEVMTSMTFPLAFFKSILKVPSWLMMKLSNVVIKYIFRAPVDDIENAITKLDLQDFVEGSISDDNDEIEANMFKNALHLKKVKVKECMVPRTEIAHIDVTAGIDELKELFLETRHSRIIVSDNDVDNVLGYVHHLQLLKNPKQLKRHIMDLSYVPEVMNVFDLMMKFIKDGNNLACVVDEFGGTAGIITLEDILEEIFGEIEDEHDVEEYIEIKLSDNEYVFSGRLEIDYLNEKYPDLELPEGDYETLSGYIVMTSGQIPNDGDKLELKNFHFTIEQVSDKKIETIRVKKLDFS